MKSVFLSLFGSLVVASAAAAEGQTKITARGPQPVGPCAKFTICAPLFARRPLPAGPSAPTTIVCPPFAMCFPVRAGKER